MNAEAVVLMRKRMCRRSDVTPRYAGDTRRRVVPTVLHNYLFSNHNLVTDMDSGKFVVLGKQV